MAWYALYKWFIPWRKISYVNWISWYKRYLYDIWYESLSEDDRLKEKERLRKVKEKRIREGEMALEHLSQMLSTMDKVTHGRLSEYMHVYKDKQN